MARLAYLGTPELAVPPLRALLDAGHDVALVVTRADKRRGRGAGPSPSPVKRAALELGLTVTDDIHEVTEVGAELGVVVAYGRIIGVPVLDRLRLVNLHFSLLPRWRGAAPVERALLAGDAVTGVCVMDVEQGLDTGPLYACTEVPIGEDDLSTVRQRLVDVGSRLLVDLLAGGVAGLPAPRPQEGEPSYAEKLTARDLELDWRRPARELARVVRLGRAFTTFRGRRLGILQAVPVPPELGADLGRAGDVAPEAGAGAGLLDGDTVGTGAGRLRLVLVQPEGRRPMSAADWLRGARPAPGEALGEPAVRSVMSDGDRS